MGTVPTGIGIGRCIGIGLGSVETLLHITIEPIFICIGIGIGIGVGQWKHTISKTNKRVLCLHYSQFLMTLTLRFVLQNITACVIVKVSYRSHSVSNFHSSFSTATKNCLMPSNVNSSLKKGNQHFSSV